VLGAPVNTTTGSNNASDPETRNLTYSARGLFDCNGAAYSPVGLPGPSQVFVPVHDDAAFSQVRTLTYKECVIKRVASHQAMAVQASLVNTSLKMINENGLIIKDVEKYLQDAEIDRMRKFIKMCKKTSKNADDIQTCGALASEFLEKIKDPYAALKCPVDQGILEKFKNNELVSFEDKMEIYSNPQCLSLSRYFIAKNIELDELSKARSRALYEAPEGIRPVESIIPQKVCDTEDDVFKCHTENKKVVVTPSIVVSGQLNNVLGSGLRRVEMADDIDELVQSLLANLHNRALDASRGGLYGITRPMNGELPYTTNLQNQEQAVANQFPGLLRGCPGRLGGI